MSQCAGGAFTWKRVGGTGIVRTKRDVHTGCGTKRFGPLLERSCRQDNRPVPALADGRHPDPLGEHEPWAFVNTDLATISATIPGWPVSRWRAGTTFQVADAHLGFETHRKRRMRFAQGHAGKPHSSVRAIDEVLADCQFAPMV